MTIGIERARALILARDFLRELINTRKTPKIPKSVRENAFYILKHFPDDRYLEILAEILIYADDPQPEKPTRPRAKRK